MTEAFSFSGQPRLDSKRINSAYQGGIVCLQEAANLAGEFEPRYGPDDIALFRSQLLEEILERMIRDSSE